MANGLETLFNPVGSFLEGKRARIADDEQKRAISSRNQLAQLAGQAFTAPPEQRNTLLAQAGQAGGLEAASQFANVFKSLDDNQRSMLKQKSDELGRTAYAILQAPREQQGQLYMQALEQAKASGMDVSAYTNLDPMTGARRALASTVEVEKLFESMNPKPQGLMNVAPGGSIYDPMSRQVAYQAPYKPEAQSWQSVNVPTPDGRGRQMNFNPKTGQYSDPFGQAPQRNDGPVIGADRANFHIQKLRKQGYEVTPEVEAQIRSDLAAGGAYFNTADNAQTGGADFGLGVGPAKPNATDQKAEAQRQKMAASLSKRLTDEQVPLIDTQLNTIESSLAPYLDANGRVSRDIPGFGRFDSLKPDMLSSPEALDLRQQVALLSNGILKSRSGAAVTDSELRRFLQEAGTGKGIPEEQLVKGVRLIRRWFNAQKNNIKGGYSPDVVEAYIANAPENSGLFDNASSKSASSAGKTRLVFNPATGDLQ